MGGGLLRCMERKISYATGVSKSDCFALLPFDRSASSPQASEWLKADRSRIRQTYSQ